MPRNLRVDLAGIVELQDRTLDEASHWAWQIARVLVHDGCDQLEWRRAVLGPDGAGLDDEIVGVAAVATGIERHLNLAIGAGQIQLITLTDRLQVQSDTP